MEFLGPRWSYILKGVSMKYIIVLALMSSSMLFAGGIKIQNNTQLPITITYDTYTSYASEKNKTEVILPKGTFVVEKVGTGYKVNKAEDSTGKKYSFIDKNDISRTDFDTGRVNTIEVGIGSTPIPQPSVQTSPITPPSPTTAPTPTASTAPSNQPLPIAPAVNTPSPTAPAPAVIVTPIPATPPSTAAPTPPNATQLPPAQSTTQPSNVTPIPTTSPSTTSTPALPTQSTITPLGRR